MSCDLSTKFYVQINELALEASINLVTALAGKFTNISRSIVPDAEKVARDIITSLNDLATRINFTTVENHKDDDKLTLKTDKLSLRVSHNIAVYLIYLICK